jgi:uncharacterized protein
MRAIEVEIPTAGATLAGTLSLPGELRPPGVMLIGGTFSDLRDGDADPRHRPDIPPHGMYRHLAEDLTRNGFAVLRIDRRGCGASSGSRPDRATEIADALRAWDWFGSRGDVEPAAMVGESAGAYVLCRLMAAGARPTAVVLQGALFRSIEGLLRFNAERAREYYERGDHEREWLWTHARREYESAVVGEALIEAIGRGATFVTASDSRCTVDRDLTDLAFDLRHPPAEQFRFVRCPALVLHGADDLNVPVEDSFAICADLWRRGNRGVDVVIISRADHSLQQTPIDHEERLRQRMAMTSFVNPFHPRYPGVVTEYLRRQLLQE